VQRADPGKPPVLLNSTLNNRLISELALAARCWAIFSTMHEDPGVTQPQKSRPLIVEYLRAHADAHRIGPSAICNLETWHGCLLFESHYAPFNVKSLRRTMRILSLIIVSLLKAHSPFNKMPSFR
jgi:hypothetical protein